MDSSLRNKIILGGGFTLVAVCCAAVLTSDPVTGYCQDEIDGVIANRHCAIDEQGRLTDPYPGNGTSRVPSIFITDGTYRKGDHIPATVDSVLATNTDGRDDSCIVETGPLPGEPGGFGGALNTWFGALGCGE